MAGFTLIARPVVILALAGMGATQLLGAVDTGHDLVEVFARARVGEPLRAVAIGGSITQAGEGWIGGWLRDQFPCNAVTMYNAGMSATGSDLAVFRLERDVISCQPDLVLIEFAVNDGGLSDADAIRYLESLVVRLKSLPKAPAIVFIEAAAKEGSLRTRHQQVARYYGLLDIDLQQAVDAQLLKEHLPWSELMADDVHPNEKGHAFYSRVIAEKLAPFIEQAQGGVREKVEIRPLPKPLSRLPLLLDGRMQPLSAASGWQVEANLPFWWNRFFLGVLSSSQPGAMLRLPIRGTAVGLFYAMDGDYGRFYASADGGVPAYVDCHHRGGYEYRLLNIDMAPQEHLVTVVLPQDSLNAPVKLGYLLVAGETGASRTLAKQGTFTPALLRKFVFETIPARSWEWVGPFGGKEQTRAVTLDLETVFAAEPEGANEKPSLEWKRLTGDSPVVDFAKQSGINDRGVNYARTSMHSDSDQQIWLRWTLDYFGKLWVNGKLVKTVSEKHAGPLDPIFVSVPLRAGQNDLVVKIHSGSKGNQFSMGIQKRATPIARSTL